MDLTVVVQNLGHGGLKDGDGNPEDRWPKLAERIEGAAEVAGADHVDVVMLCEVVGWHLYGHKQLARAKKDLGLDAAPLAPSRSGYGTGLLFRPESLGAWARHNPDFGKEALHGLAVTSFEIPGLPAPLSFLPVHFTPFSAEQALIEANYAATRGYKYGPFAVLAGDVNYAPASVRSPQPDFSEMRPYNVGSRTLLPSGDFVPGDALEPDRRVTRKLAHNGFIDVAWHLFEQTKDEVLLAPTGTDDRIDQAWVSGPLAGAVSNYHVLATPAEASDHHGLVFRIDTDAIDVTRPWAYR
ncbi:endonuclease/exonuclease/phosphatase family protein [Kitasatospora sp. NPDC056446]|uniref:endonuclease/exonuclease/phosphatase family protein n=1 Tax=Kitasatospora sp. NPDC056446 TaxID=3345819 RepID=UPI0036C78DB2